jgi:hypothetical protein
MMDRARTLQMIENTLLQLGDIHAALTAARNGSSTARDGGDVSVGFRAIAQVTASAPGFATVQELAALAERFSDDDTLDEDGERVDVLQHAADVLALLLKDHDARLHGRRGADVAPVADALRARLEHALLVGVL